MLEIACNKIQYLMAVRGIDYNNNNSATIIYVGTYIPLTKSPIIFGEPVQVFKERNMTQIK
jgi:hypothetical protein